jgi:penicillin G amidase
MKKWLKIVIGTVITVLIILLIGGAFFYNMLKSSLPKYSGTEQTNEIKDDLYIYRDSMAVPYIVAQDDEDAAFGLGYVHAQERIFTMDIARRAGEGKLSEIFGKSAVPFDAMFKTIGIERTVKKIIAQMSPGEINILQAYSNGVNKYLRDYKGKYPVEFDVLGYDPANWTPTDCIVIGRMMAWELNLSWWTDYAYTQLAQKVGAQKLEEIIPTYPEDAPFVVPEEIKKYPKISDSFIKTDREFRNFFQFYGTHLGSNNWIVDGKKSDSGKPIIANDTHLTLGAPSKWFVAVIKSKDWNASGFTLPGVPVIIIGKNENISWALTNIMQDDADFYLEKLDSTKTKYYYKNKWWNLDIIKDTIKIKDAKDTIITIRSTDHGPIISDIHPFGVLYPKEKNDSVFISMKWLGDEVSDEFKTFLEIDKAKNWKEFNEAFDSYATPGQNFIYGDKKGNIGYVFGSRLPIRDNDDFTFIFDGITDKYDWKGFVPRKDLPSMLNPKEDFIATANNKVEKDFKYHISNFWEPASRIERIDDLLTSKNKFSAEDFMNYQMDFVSPYAKQITKYILAAFKNVKILDNDLSLTLKLFSDWNYEMNQYSQVPTIYAVFLNHLIRNIYRDEMGDDLFNEFQFTTNTVYRSLLKVLSDPSNSWFDNINTPKKETENEIIRQSMNETLDGLEAKFGGNISTWQWGKLHKVTFKHLFSGHSTLIDKFIDIGPFGIGGDGTTIFNTEYPFYKSLKDYPEFSHTEFENTVGPVMRYIFDFSKPNQFYMILTTGESGNVFSHHYKDMTRMWLEGKYLTVKTDLQSIEKNKNNLLHFIKAN